MVQNQSQSLSDAEEIEIPRRVKKVLFSDKSESSVNENMDDTPSNYNIANCRFEGESLGLKAMLLYAKNYGIQIGNRDQSTEEESSNRRSRT